MGKTFKKMNKITNLKISFGQIFERFIDHFTFFKKNNPGCDKKKL